MTSPLKIDFGLDALKDEDEPSPAPPKPKRRQFDPDALEAAAAASGFDRPVGPPTQVRETPPVETSSRPRSTSGARSAAPRIDGRSLRATGRTAQFNVRVKSEVKDRYIQLAQAMGNVSLGELLEVGLELLVEQHRGGQGRR